MACSTPMASPQAPVRHDHLPRWLRETAYGILLLLAVALGAGVGVLFVYTSELPEVRALEDYKPDTVTELYADDGQLIGSFALQRRILVSYEQIPAVLRNALIATEDQHFETHWGVDVPRVVKAAWTNAIHGHITSGASTLTMQLAGTLFLNRADRSYRRKIQEALLAVQIERYYTKRQILTMYCNQIYLGHGNYGFEAASEFYFGKQLKDLTLPEAALLVGIVPGPSYSPLLHPSRALARRDLVLGRLEAEGKLSPQDTKAAQATPLGLHVQYPRNDFAPYFIEEIRKYLEHNYGTEAVHEHGLRVYTTLNIAMQRGANRAIKDGLHAYTRRHGWKGGLTNILSEHLGTLEKYQSDDWRRPMHQGDYVTALVTEAGDSSAALRIGPYHATLLPSDMAWTGQKHPDKLLKPGDLAMVRLREITGSTARVDLEEKPTAQAAFVALENSTGEIKAMVGGYSFDDSKFNRATQATRQVGSSFKPYLYTAAIEEGHDPFETIVDQPITFQSGGQEYSPHNYDGKFEGRITLRRALADSRNVPAVELANKIGIQNVIDMTRRFGVTSPLQPYLPLVLGAAEITLLEHTSSFTVFPNDGIRIEPHYIRRVTAYDGAVLEDARPKVYDVLKPEVARTMTAMLEDVVLLGTGQRAKELKRPTAGKTGTTSDFTDAWYMGFTPSLTAGVWVGNDDPSVPLGNKETGAKAALPIWIEFMKDVYDDKPAEQFVNVVPLEKLAPSHLVLVDTPDSAPAEDGEEHGIRERKPSATPPTAPKTSSPTARTTSPPAASPAPGHPPGR
ncbi:MAG TPA: PBP1A family penicillin-binding protein [Patescibacteria group bacterium]|nr:PBP1A family penicillin-binding protein [Patescibacteria group bacterium]